MISARHYTAAVEQVLGLAILMLVAAALLLAILTAILIWEARRPARRTAGYALARGLSVDPGDMGLAYESWSLRRMGAELPVWEVAGAAGRAGPTAVLVHGWGQSRIDMLARSGPWIDLAPRVVLYDRRGHGEARGAISPLGHGEDDDLLALLDELGEGPFLLAGWSMGAVIAIAAAARDAERARIIGVIAHAPYADLRSSLRGRLRSKGLPSRPFADLAMLWFRVAGLKHGSTLPRAAALRCPLLVIHGSADTVTAAEEARAIAEASVHGEFISVVGAGHADVQADDAVRRLVNGVTDGGAGAGARVTRGGGAT
jgi:pimeloyl-ACP methyl ester carboxylesterase